MKILVLDLSYFSLRLTCCIWSKYEILACCSEQTKRYTPPPTPPPKNKLCEHVSIIITENGLYQFPFICANITDLLRKILQSDIYLSPLLLVNITNCFHDVNIYLYRCMSVYLISCNLIPYQYLTYVYNYKSSFFNHSTLKN